MSVLINASTSTGLVQSADTSGEIELQSNGTTALKVNTNEGIQILNCLGVGNATPSTSGAGITFPATQSASTDANTLDDYEEGTWTPVITPNSGSLTSYTSNGSYTKVGKMVVVRASCTITNGGTASGTMAISGFPFTNSNDNNLSPSLTRETLNSGTYYQVFINANATTGSLRGQSDAAVSWSNNNIYAFTITYFV